MDGVMNDGEINVQLGEAIDNFIDVPMEDEDIYLYLGIVGLGSVGGQSLFNIRVNGESVG